MKGLSDLDSEDRMYSRRRFGPVMRVFASLVLNVRHMRKMEEMIEGKDETLIAFKDSHLNAVGSMSTSAAIMSQLSSTTLQMPGLSNVHWTAPGFMIASLLFGVLAVILSCMQQQLLGMLNNAEGIRMWLSNGHFYSPHHHCHPLYDENCGEADSSAHTDRTWGLTSERTAIEDNDEGGRRRLQVSVASLQLLSLPQNFLAVSVVCFLSGFGLYLGFAWRQDLDDTPARNNNEAVLIMFVTAASCAVLGGMGTSFWKILEVGSAEQIWEKDKVSGQGVRNVHEVQSSSEDEPEDHGHSASSSDLPTKHNHSNARTHDGDWKKHEEIAEALAAAAEAHRRLADLLKS
ncbi:hypothetical protein K490DRAFT_56195 [Saccharata proteae CBS 121410]|uniref:Uncharacterized protein n=1 Tax=Saccharata proteae CBS 121410 TaxID=1314787 RepID=A0A9P4LZK0_9PEZI|nr:hypothetical protein K490DRAFT_56195 [Saccharata proteae CBS 121410]